MDHSITGFYFQVPVDLQGDTTLRSDLSAFAERCRDQSDKVDYREFIKDVRTAAKLWDKVGGFYKCPLSNGFSTSTHATLLTDLAKLTSSPIVDNTSFSSTPVWSALFDGMLEDPPTSTERVTVTKDSETYKQLITASHKSGARLFYELVSRKKPAYFYGLCRILFTPMTRG